MNKKMSKRQRDIKTKLMAAVAMLLVSSIMMVSTTYAWFTLSTAPEVTGISTAVGANGNLEMALMPPSGDVTKITSGTADSMASQATTKANITWGNLVDLAATNEKGVNAYGLHEITLYPAKLNGTDKINTSAPLAIPVYGSDGRVSDLDETSTVTGVYLNDDFYQAGVDVDGVTPVSNPTGVRAIGTVSGMTPRQSAYRGALAAASTVALNAQNAASSALSKEGPQLASIAIEHATSTTESYTKADLQSLLNMVNALLGTDANNNTDGALGMIEAAMRQYLYAIEIHDNANYAEKEADIVGTATQKPKAFSELTVPTDMSEMITKLNGTLTKARQAKSILEEQIAANKDSYAWADFDDALTLLANPNSMEINSIPVPKLNDKIVKDDGGTPDDPNDDTYETDGEGKPLTNMSNLVSSVMNNGLNLTLASGSGVYADVADHCGNYSASIKIPSITYGVTITNVPANMKTATNVDPVYLTQADTYARVTVGAPEDGGGGTLPITDYYGYIIDLAFRTNAADSHLRLQTKGIDRVYAGNEQNEATMGGGSTMTFKWSDTAAATGQAQTVLNNKAVALMEHIKVVFFDPTNQNTILAYGKLNGEQSTNADTNEITVGLTLADANGDPVENLIALEQNKAHRVSVLVYLDGETLSNADVAYTSDTSMTGSLNLQFCSSATLVPMEYSDLRTGANNGNAGGNNQPASPVKVNTVNIEGGYAAEVYYGTYNGATGFSATITKDGTAVTSDATVTIDGQPATYVQNAWVATTSKTEAPDSVTVVVTPSN